jgi:hypothetical protein
MTKPQTVVELPEFQRRAKAVMSDDEREAAIVWLAENPEAGISLGGGLRKVRIPREGGKAWRISDDLRLWRSAHADLPGYSLRQE